MAKLKAPKGVCSFTHDGVEYEVKRARIDVPAEAVAVALAHGFIALDEAQPDAGEDEQPAEQPAEQPQE